MKKLALITLAAVVLALAAPLPPVSAEEPSQFIVERIEWIESSNHFGDVYSAFWGWGVGISDDKDFEWLAHSKSDGLVVFDLSTRLSPPCIIAVSSVPQGEDKEGSWVVRRLGEDGVGFTQIETTNGWKTRDGGSLSIRSILTDFLKKLEALACFDGLELKEVF